MRPPRTRLRSTAQQQTDATLLQLHALIADKLIAQPELVPPLLAKLEQRYQAGLIKHWGYIRWYSMLYPSDFKMQRSLKAPCWKTVKVCASCGEKPCSPAF